MYVTISVICSTPLLKLNKFKNLILFFSILSVWLIYCPILSLFNLKQIQEGGFTLIYDQIYLYIYISKTEGIGNKGLVTCCLKRQFQFAASSVIMWTFSVLFLWSSSDDKQGKTKTQTDVHSFVDAERIQATAKTFFLFWNN